MPGMLFEDMGITYLGPVDGHNVEEMVQVLKEAKRVRHAVPVSYTHLGKGGGLEAVYEWIRSLVFYLILMTTVLNFLPDRKYEKYLRLFTGMVFILLVFGPLEMCIRDSAMSIS